MKKARGAILVAAGLLIGAGAQRSESAPGLVGSRSLSLKGTVALGSAPPLAIIHDSATGRTRTYAEGDCVDGATVMKIARDSVLIERGGAAISIRRDGISEAPGGGAQGDCVAAAGAPDGGGDARLEGFDSIVVEKLGDDAMGVKSSAISGALARPDLFLRGAEVEWGSEGGIRFADVAQGSLLAKLGLEAGDRLARINGKDVAAPRDIMEGVTALAEKGVVEVGIERGRGMKRFTYAITDHERCGETALGEGER